MDAEKRYDLITKGLEEVITENDLKHFIEIDYLKHYIGFEISGRLHIGSGFMTMMKIKDFLKAKVKTSIFLADWHAWINEKLNDDLETIRKIGAGYFKEMMIASSKIFKIDEDDLKFVIGSELYHNNDDYWATVIDVSKHTTLSRVFRSITILGRKEGMMVDFAKLIYPPMQVADIFIQDISLAHAGIDQRKAHVIAREVAKKLKFKPLKINNEILSPVALHHPLVMGLQKPPKLPQDKTELREVMSEMKMSKSKPNSAIFLDDSPEEIRWKIRKAYCPEGDIEYNPILNWTKNIIFNYQDTFVIERKPEFGGTIEFDNYYELEKMFAEKKLHPLDLKNAVAEKINEIIAPARDYLNKPRVLKLKEEFNNLIAQK